MKQNKTVPLCVRQNPLQIQQFTSSYWWLIHLRLVVWKASDKNVLKQIILVPLFFDLLLKQAASKHVYTLVLLAECKQHSANVCPGSCCLLGIKWKEQRGEKKVLNLQTSSLFVWPFTRLSLFISGCFGGVDDWVGRGRGDLSRKKKWSHSPAECDVVGL